MTVLNVSAETDHDGTVRLALQTPLKDQRVDVVVVVQPATTAPSYDFSDIAGHLQWTGDAVAAQRGLRDEW